MEQTLSVLMPYWVEVVGLILVHFQIWVKLDCGGAQQKHLVI